MNSSSPGLKDSFKHILKHLKARSPESFSESEVGGNFLSSPHHPQMKQLILKESPPAYSERLMNELFKAGPVEELIHNEEVTEIIINGKNHILYEESGTLKVLKDEFLSDLSFRNFVHRVCEEADMILNLNHPFADGSWQGFRVHLMMHPVVHVDFHISFRKHPQNPWSFELLKARQWAPGPAIKQILGFIESKKNLLIVGPTSSGKTSVLNSCLQTVPPNERVLIIEDSEELVLPNTFSTRLLARSGGTQELKPVLQEELVRQSLRMRPDRIVMGETRGTEAKDLLMALATGHRGSLGTLHARDHKQALWRLEMMVQMGAPHWSTYTIRQMIVLSIDCLLILGRVEGERKLIGIYKLAGVEETGYLFETLFFHQLDSQVHQLGGTYGRGGL